MNRFSRRFQSCFEQIRDPLLIADVDGTIRRSNPAAHSILDIGERRCVSDVVWLDRRVVFDGESIVSLLREPSPVIGRRLKDLEGNETDVVVDILDLAGKNGGSKLKLIHIKDHSPYTKIERWKDELISMAAHEIKNPLAAMRNSMNVLVSQTPAATNEGQRNLLDVSIRSIDRLTRLLDSFLDVSRIHSGSCVPEPRWVDAGEFVTEVIGAFKTLFNVRRQRLQCSVSDDIHRIYVDAPKLEQILINLLNNAIKCTQEGGEVVVNVEPASLEVLRDDLRILPWGELAELKFVRIAVKDTGIGMTGETLSHLFTRYYGDKERNGSRGAHLGLSISKTLVEAQNGTLEFESELGVGTRATVSLPADDATFSLLSRLKSIERVLARLLNLHRGAVLYVFRKDISPSWARVIDGWKANPVVNPTIEDEKSSTFLVWTLGERVALSLLAGANEKPATRGLFGAVEALGGPVASHADGYTITSHDLSMEDLRVAKVLGLVMREVQERAKVG